MKTSFHLTAISISIFFAANMIGCAQTSIVTYLNRGDFKAAQNVIKAGADVNEKDKYGRTGLHVAANRGYEDIVRLLVKNGADVNVRDNYKSTALHEATNNNSYEIVSFLIENRADINARSFDGRTPLHDAAILNNRNIANLLIEKGADIDAKDNYGKTALNLANEKGSNDVAKILYIALLKKNKKSSSVTGIDDAKKVERDGVLVKDINGIISDRITKLEWYAGPDKDTNWYEAKIWVDSLEVGGGGWRMPTNEELKTLYINGAGKRNMSPLFKTTGWWVWSGETKLSSSVWDYKVDKDGYTRDRISRPDFSYDIRAFAVRSKHKPAVKKETKNISNLELEVLKNQYEEQRKKSELLAKELAEREQREKNLLTKFEDEQKRREKELIEKLQKANQRPPFVFVGSPKSETDVEVGKINFSGVVEDDVGIKNVEFIVNGKLIEDLSKRGIFVSKAEKPKKYEFHKRIVLEKGSNLLQIKATDSDELVTIQEVTVNYIDTRKNLWAAVIGIDNYQNVRHLKYATKDARAFYKHLVQNIHIPEENITLLINQQAHLEQIRSTLGTHLKRNAGKDDMVLIYFAGHGATEEDPKSPGGDGLEKYILPYDAELEDLFATALPMSDIAKIFNRIQSERLIFIADACYSGASGGRTIGLTGMRANISEAFMDRIAGGKGRVIITASGANEVSVENDKLKHGVFTYYLVEGLQGKADIDNDGNITVDEVYHYVAKKVPLATGQAQHPVKKGSVEGHLIMGIVE